MDERVKFNLQAAEDRLRAAKKLLDDDLIVDSINRSYYFFTPLALLLLKIKLTSQNTLPLFPTSGNITSRLAFLTLNSPNTLAMLSHSATTATTLIFLKPTKATLNCNTIKPSNFLTLSSIT